MLFVLAAVLPVWAKNNIAPECKIDSFCGEDSGHQAGMLVDRDINYDTKWQTSDGASHTGEPHWIILDFETEKTFDSIRLIKASQGTEDFGRTEFDASGFIFEVSTDKTEWFTILTVTDNGDADIYEASFIPVEARYLKLSITNPGQDENSGENQTSRLYDLKVFEYTAPVEPDETEEISETEEPPEPSTNTSDHLLLFAVWLIISAVSSGLLFKFIQPDRR